MLYVIAFIFIVGAFAEDDCPTDNIFNLYSELNCEPIFERGSKCPTRFNCDNIQSRVKNQCYYKGRAYTLGERLPENETSSNCLAGCKCTNHGNDAAFTCASVECPEHWNQPKENCRHLYSRDQCCATEVLCLEKDMKRMTCQYDGNTYYEGEKFYPEGGKCKTCYCKPGFDGKLVEPFCEKIDCGVELVDSSHLKKNCAPVFYTKDDCCPIRWICPSSDTTVIPHMSSEAKSSSGKCRFGNLVLNQYDVLQDGSDKCECLYPPYVSCFEKKI